MDDLKKWKDSPLWDEEESKNEYANPLHVEPAIALTQGTKLAGGDLESETYRRGEFVCYKSRDSHIGPFKHAIDFLISDGTPVYAAHMGVVIEIQESSNKWGPTEEYRDLLNYMTIQHPNGEFSQYCHLAQWSCRDSGIVVGSQVSRNTKIAIVGKTGWTDRDHLHLVIFRSAQNESPFGFKSLKPRFK